MERRHKVCSDFSTRRRRAASRADDGTARMMPPRAPTAAARVLAVAACWRPIRDFDPANFFPFFFFFCIRTDRNMQPHKPHAYLGGRAPPGRDCARMRLPGAVNSSKMSNQCALAGAGIESPPSVRAATVRVAARSSPSSPPPPPPPSSVNARMRRCRRGPSHRGRPVLRDGTRGLGAVNGLSAPSREAAVCTVTASPLSTESPVAQGDGFRRENLLDTGRAGGSACTTSGAACVASSRDKARLDVAGSCVSGTALADCENVTVCSRIRNEPAETGQSRGEAMAAGAVGEAAGAAAAAAASATGGAPRSCGAGCGSCRHNESSVTPATASASTVALLRTPTSCR